MEEKTISTALAIAIIVECVLEGFSEVGMCQVRWAVKKMAEAGISKEVAWKGITIWGEHGIGTCWHYLGDFSPETDIPAIAAHENVSVKELYQILSTTHIRGWRKDETSSLCIHSHEELEKYISGETPTNLYPFLTDQAVA